MNKVYIEKKSINNAALGYFELLPLEVKFKIFTYLPVEELSIMTITSKLMRNVVETYRNSMWSQQFLLPVPIKHEFVPLPKQAELLDQFVRLGLLTKRSTCLYTTRNRLQLIQQYLQKYLCQYNKSCNSPIHCIALLCYGKFLHTIIAGWDEKECTKVYDVIMESTHMNKNLKSIVNYKPGAYRDMELNVRLFFRRVFLNNCSSGYDRAFWLNLILRHMPMVNQARVLFLLFGPISGEDIQWHEMCDSTPLSRDQAATCFGDLAHAFRTLNRYSEHWTEDDVISVIDEVTSCPEEWLAENVAHLLFLCGDTIVLKVLKSKAINARIQELASIITSLCLVSVRHESGMGWIMEVVSGVMSVMDSMKNRTSLLYSIVDMFKEYALDLHEYAEADDSSSELDALLEAQSQLMKEMTVRAFRGDIEE